MSADLQLFNFPDTGQEVRVLMIDGSPWWVAADVCAVLEISNSRDALSRLDDDEKGVGSTDTLGGMQRLSIVNEPGLYSLVLGSRRPQAKAFKRWIIHEVVPSIRRTGSYGVHKELTRVEFAEMLLESEKAREAQRLDLLVLEAQKKALEAKKREDAPKVTAYDHLMDSEGTFSMAAAAQILDMGFGRTGLFGLLRTEKVITQSVYEPRPLQPYLDRGYFTLKAGPGRPTVGGHETRHTIRVTPKGLDWLRKRFCDAA